MFSFPCASSVPRSVALILCGLSVAQAGSPPADQRLEELVEQLDAQQFSVRQQASQQLYEMGPRSFPALQAAAQTKSREVTHRAIGILQKHYENDGGPHKSAAQETLEALAASEHRFASSRAKIILAPPPPTRLAVPVVRRIVNAPPKFRGQMIRRARMKSGNNTKEMELESATNKIKIQEDANGRIKVEITEQLDGKPVVTRIDAKDADDLKKQAADVYKLYEQFGRPAGNPGGRRLLGRVPLPAVPQLPADQMKRRLESLKRLEESVEKRINDLRKEIDSADDKLDLQRKIEAMERSKKRFEELKKRYRQQPERS